MSSWCCSATGASTIHCRNTCSYGDTSSFIIAHITFSYRFFVSRFGRSDLKFVPWAYHDPRCGDCSDVLGVTREYEICRASVAAPSCYSCSSSRKSRLFCDWPVIEVSVFHRLPRWGPRPVRITRFWPYMIPYPSKTSSRAGFTRSIRALCLIFSQVHAGAALCHHPCRLHVHLSADEDRAHERTHTSHSMEHRANDSRQMLWCS